MSPRTLLGTLCLLLAAGPARAADVSTNGTGGGPWTDPATWRGKVVPGPGDDVFIQKHDVVVLDRTDDGKPTCKKLQIDPRGGLTFKSGAGKLALAVTDGIESFGAIRLDATRSAGDQFEVRLLGDTAAKRQVKLGKGGALLLYGRANLPEGRLNVLLSAPRPADAKEEVPALVEAEGSVMIDWQRAAVSGVKLLAKKIDNTGSKPNERIRVSDCRFTGTARAFFHNCDTPEVLRNSFEYTGAKPLDEHAISIYICSLPEVKDNKVRGPFVSGITLYASADAVATGNVVEKAPIGFQCGGGVSNAMIKNNVARGCETGIKLEGTTGVIEDTLVEGSVIAYTQTNTYMQLTNFQVKDLDKKGMAIVNEGGTTALLNCNIVPAQVKAAPQAPPAGKPPVPSVTCLQYLVVRVKDAPAGALVDVRTATPPPPAGAADPNVRNTPAPLIDGLTPLPSSLTPLVVRSWIIDPAGKLAPAPEYTIKVLGMAPKEGADRPVLKMQAFRPAENAFRAQPNEKTPTLEVSLK